MPKEKIEQISLSELLDAGELTWECLTVGRHLIVPTSKLPADAALRRSIEDIGLLSPLTVVEFMPKDVPGAHTMFRVIDGNRRFAAAVEADLPEIPVRVMKGATDKAEAALTLTSNGLRSSNPISELESVLKLAGEYSDRQIAYTTGMGIHTIRKRMRLRELPEAILQGVLDGDVAIGTAEKLAKLPDDKIAELEELFHEAGKLTANDVANAQRVRSAAAMPELPPMFDMASLMGQGDRVAATSLAFHHLETGGEVSPGNTLMRHSEFAGYDKHTEFVNGLNREAILAKLDELVQAARRSAKADKNRIGPATERLEQAKTELLSEVFGPEAAPVG